MDQAGALMANAVIARHLRIYGRVQGVWYRAWAVETFIQRAHDGPPNAEVARIDVTDAPGEHRNGFDKRSTC